MIIKILYSCYFMKLEEYMQKFIIRLRIIEKLYQVKLKRLDKQTKLIIN